MNSIDLVVAERCAHYGIIATCLKHRPASRGGDVLTAARMQIAWELRRQWKQHGLVFEPSFTQIAEAVGYKWHTGAQDAVNSVDQKKAGRELKHAMREDRNMELAAMGGVA